MKIRYLKESRTPEVEKLKDDIDLAYQEYYNSNVIEEILIKHNASETGNEGYFTGMSDSDIKEAWKEIQTVLQKEVFTYGFDDINSKLIDIFNLHYSSTDLADRVKSLDNDTKDLVDNLRNMYMDIKANNSSIEEIAPILVNISNISKNIKYWSDKILRLSYHNDGTKK